MRRKVLIIPNVSGWILGDIAKQISFFLGDEYDFYYITELVLRRRPDLLNYLLPRVDFVHCMSQSATNLVLSLSAFKNIPLITWIHHVTQWKIAHQKAVDHSRLIVASTDKWAEEIQSQVNQPIQIQVVHYGVDTFLFKNIPVKRSQFGIHQNSFVIGFVSSRGSNYDDGRKGVDTLFQVLSRCNSEIPNLQVCFVGIGWEKDVIQLRKIGIDAINIGFVPQHKLPLLYSCFDVYLMTSRVEGGHCTVLESMSCGTPVVATRVGLVPLVIQDGVNGFSAYCDDINQLVHNIKQIAFSPELAKQIGQNARNTIEMKGLSWHQTLQALREPYAQMVIFSKQYRTEQLPKTSIHPEQLMKAVCAADGFLWTISLVFHQQISIKASRQMLFSLWYGLRIDDIIRGLGLISRIIFREKSL